MFRVSSRSIVGSFSRCGPPSFARAAASSRQFHRTSALWSASTGLATEPAGASTEVTVDLPPKPAQVRTPRPRKPRLPDALYKIKCAWATLEAQAAEFTALQKHLYITSDLSLIECSKLVGKKSQEGPEEKARLLSMALASVEGYMRAIKDTQKTRRQQVALLQPISIEDQQRLNLAIAGVERANAVVNLESEIQRWGPVIESLQEDKEKALQGELGSTKKRHWAVLAMRYSWRAKLKAQRIKASLGSQSSPPQPKITAAALAQLSNCNPAESAEKGPKESSQPPAATQGIETPVLEDNSTASTKSEIEEHLQSPAATQGIEAPVLEDNSNASTKSETEEPSQSPAATQGIETQVLEDNSTASTKSETEEPSQSTAATQGIETPVLEDNSTESTKSETEEHSPEEHSRLSFDPQQNIVQQILASSSQHAPALSPVKKKRAENLRDQSDESQKETLKHIARYIETKHCGQLSPEHSKLVALDAPMPPVPGLSFGLDRVLFNPGVYQLRDPRSRVYNFDPYLGEIMPVSEFDFSTLKPYITSSQDALAREMAAKNQKKYFGSSSSMTSVLSHFHYLLSAWRPISVRQMSCGFPDHLRNFTRLLRAPTAMFLHYKEKEDTYAIDADKEYDSSNILANLGKSMEKLLTLPKEEFERYRRSSANKVSAEEESAVPESYHFTGAGNFLMRSQLDAYDPRLPGTGMYDLKTRAVVSIRMDVTNHENGIGYEIKDRFGTYESFEREYFDMIRAAFLKYSLQVRIGRMDGIFVAYHNIERIFGFQYISLPEMDQSLHGQNNTVLGDREFQHSLGLWEQIMDKATAKFPKQSLRFHFETREAVTPFMYIFAEPVTDKQMYAIQNKNKAEIDAFNDRLFNPNQTLSQVPDLGSYIEPEETSAAEETPAEETPAKETPANEDAETSGDLIAMTLIIQNRVNGQIVERPENLKFKDTWEVSYELNELAPEKGRTLLNMMKKRRADVWKKVGADDESGERDSYLALLNSITRRGRAFRQQENLKDEQGGIIEYESSRKSG